MELLRSVDVLNIHTKVINPQELQGLAGNKSLEAIINRIENRIRYGADWRRRRSCCNLCCCYCGWPRIQ